MDLNQALVTIQSYMSHVNQIVLKGSALTL